MSSTEHVTFAYYHYNPSLAAAVIFIIAFSLSTFYHLFQLFKARTWYFIPFVVGGTFEIVGYVGRALSAHQAPTFTQGPYIIQSLLTLLAPALFAASIYMILGRIVRLVNGEKYCPVSTKWLTPVFVTGDVVSFFIQGAGGGIETGGTLDAFSRGQHIITAGLLVQIIFFLVFVAVAAIFHRRLARAHDTSSTSSHLPSSSTGASLAPAASRYLIILYIASALILVRNLIRIGQSNEGDSGPLLDNEWVVYVFDALLMFLAMGLFNVWHPSGIVKGRERKVGVADEFEFGRNGRHGERV